MSHVPTPLPAVTPQDFPVDPAHLDALREGLAVKAADAGLLDIAYRVIESPVGRLLLAATDTGIIRLAFEDEDFDSVLDDLATRVSPRILTAPDRLDPVAFELAEYFAGSRQRFTVPLDHTLSSGFRGEVQRHLPEIGYGQTRTYKQIAAEIGRPGAVRAVGTACATNPLPVIVPCHRVLRSDGTIGGYLGGTEAKRFLLDLEQAA